MDYSKTTGKILMCNNARFELLFFDLQTGKVKNKYDEILNEKWDTYTCILGWHV